MADPDGWIALQVVMMPKDANPMPTVLPGSTGHAIYATIFGGVILSHIDMAGAIGARREAARIGGNPKATFVTVAINRVEFKQPVLVGDVVKFITRVMRIGRTSITMHIDVIAERGVEPIAVTDAEVVYVAVDPTVPMADRRPLPIQPGS
jgi:acyl-CoA thioesterase YciA